MQSVDTLYPTAPADLKSAYAQSQTNIERIAVAKLTDLRALAQAKTTELRIVQARLESGKPVDLFVFVLQNPNQITQAFVNFFKVLGPKGILCHIESKFYQVMRTQNKQMAQQAIKRITAHNGKLGWNWATPRSKGFEAQFNAGAGYYQEVDIANAQQFSNSAYKQWCMQAADFYSIGDLADHYKAMAGRFNALAKMDPTQQLASLTQVVPVQELEVRGYDKDLLQYVEDEMPEEIGADPKLMSAIASTLLEKVENGVQHILSDEQGRYIKALLDPFHPDSAGVRVPSLNPIDTYTHTQFESFTLSGQMAAFGKILVVFNPTAIGPRPVVVLQDIEGNSAPLDAPAGVPKVISQFGKNYTDSNARNLAIWTTGQSSTRPFLQQLSEPVASIFPQLDKQAGKIKLVAAGMRIFKTSKGIQEAGVIRMAYRPRGGVPQTSLDKMLETGPTQRYNVKVFPSVAKDYRNRAGFLGQINYRPHVTDDVDMFYDITQLFSTDEFKTVPFYQQDYPQVDDPLFGDGSGPDAASARRRFVGPLTLFGKRPDDPTWDFLNNIPATAADPAWQASGVSYGLNALDFGRSHTMIMSIEANSQITYDVEIVRHFEIIPGEESSLEVRSAHLANDYSSPIDLIRRYQIQQLISSPFSHPQYSLGGRNDTLWTTDPIIQSSSDALAVMNNLDDSSKEQRVKGLFGGALKWLLKTLGLPLVDLAARKATEKIQSYE